jgi:probable HAF family extracellular repeat protein
MLTLPHRMTRRTLAFLAAGLAGSAAAAPPAYRLTDLGVPEGYAGAQALDVNDAGDVMGLLLDPSEPSGIPFTWTADGGMQLGQPARRTVQRTLSALGPHGQVVGWLDCHTCDRRHAFWWKPGARMHDLPGLYPDATVSADGVNDRGVIVGTSYYTQASSHVVTWQPGAGVVDRTPEVDDAHASGINDRGQITGWMSPVLHDLPHAMLLEPDGGLIDLGTFAGGFYSFGRAINEHGRVVGTGDVGGRDFKAFVWTAATGLRDIAAGTAFEGQTGDASDVGDEGDVVGYVGGRSFWWSDAEGMHLLDEMLDPGDPLAGRVAFDGYPHIGGAGRIAVSGLMEGVEHAFLLTPVP